MSIFDYLILLGVVNIIYTVVIQWIFNIPIAVLQVLFNLDHKKFLFPHMLGFLVLVALMGSITINVCLTIDDNLRVLIFKFLGGFVVYIHLIKNYYEKTEEFNEGQNIKRILIYLGAFLFYILIMIFPNLVDNPLVGMLLDAISWIYSIPVVGFLFKIGGFLVALLIIFIGIKFTFILAIEIYRNFIRRTT